LFLNLETFIVSWWIFIASPFTVEWWWDWKIGCHSNAW